MSTCKTVIQEEAFYAYRTSVACEMLMIMTQINKTQNILLLHTLTVLLDDHCNHMMRMNHVLLISIVQAMYGKQSNRN